MSTPEPLSLPSFDELDGLVDTDPIRLRDKAWALLGEVERIKAVAYTQSAMLSEITAACMTAEQERDHLKAELADLEGQNAMTESHFNNHVTDSIVEQAALTKRAEQAEFRIAEALDLASRLDPSCGRGRVQAFISDLRRALEGAVRR